MKQFQHKVEAIVIFLTNEQKLVLEKEKNPSLLIAAFSRKLNTLYGNTLPIYTNYAFESLPHEFLESNFEIDFLKKIIRFLPDSKSGDADIDEVFFAYFQGIFPLLSLNLSNELEARHRKYLSQYSYSENLPPGIVPNFLSREFISVLPDDNKLNSHEYLMKNLNHFDVEIFFKEPDLRQYRLDFSLKNSISVEHTKSILSINENIEYSEIFKLFQDKPNLFRVTPTYIELEIYRGCENSCTFCPRQFQTLENDFTHIQFDVVQNLLNSLESEFPHSMTLTFGGLGEPFLHPDLSKIVMEALSKPNLKELIIETSLYIEMEKINLLLENLKTNKDKLTIIVNLNTLKEKRYSSMYGMSSLEDCLFKINRIAEVLGKNQIHVQMLKILEVEEEIESYFNYFEKLGINVILQKYNRYLELMPEKRVSDLTPIQRNFCWHLARDFYITVNGDVSVCKQKETILGNIKTDSVMSIWEKGQNNFKDSFLQNHEKVNAPCLSCDEWYTFNA
jgi:spiro-SPASM protein